jgi:hypothetical protein
MLQVGATGIEEEEEDLLVMNKINAAGSPEN